MVYPDTPTASTEAVQLSATAVVPVGAALTLVGTLGGVVSAGEPPAAGGKTAGTMNQFVDVPSGIDGACGPAAPDSTSSEPSVPSETVLRNVALTPRLE